MCRHVCIYFFSSVSGSSDSEEIWEEEDYDEPDISTHRDALPLLPVDLATPPNNPIVTWLVGFLLLLQARHYIPDSAMNALLKFLCVLFSVLGRFSPVIASMASAIPSSVYSLGRAVGNSVGFMKYVVCPKCHKLYKLSDCISQVGARQSSTLCTFIQFPNHPYRRFRVECGQLLLKTVYFSSGRLILYPFKVFPFKTLSSSLQQLLLRPGFAELCQHWKSRVRSDYLQDIYDGKVWNDFQVVSGQPFLSGAWGLGLMINVDWFQPYKHTTYSVGVVYLTIMNLPRSIRFKRENVILVGILPGPSEPKHDINSYLEPLVNELRDLWTGVAMQVHTVTGLSSTVVRCALLCVACDLPAGRKVCGFLGHSAKLGCSKCLKAFPGGVGSMNYSGFDRSLWPSRTNDTHRNSVGKVLQCRNKQQQNSLESSNGCRYSCLLELPYFDAPRMLSIDPMHNLFLGSGKHMLQLWLTLGVIKPTHFAHLQKCIDNMIVPSDVGRIPRKIATGFSGFTADQFKNWIILFSIPALHDILPKQHLECWRYFVLACRIICKRKLSVADISLFDALLIRFCKKVQDLYGDSAVTPNMHMHGHLKEVVEDYGPVFAFWLFAYERYNGILGYQPNNNRAIETQLMSRFLKDNLANSFQFPSEFSEDFRNVCSNDLGCRDVGSVAATLSNNDETSVTFTSACSRGIFDDLDLHLLLSLFRKLNQDESNNVIFNSVFLKYTSLSLRGKSYSCSRSSRTGSPYVALAEWDEHIFGSPPTPLIDATHPDSKFRPVKIRHYIKASVSCRENVSQLLLAAVQWYRPHPSKNSIGKPVQIWMHNVFEDSAIYSFMPVQYLKCRCSFSIITFNDDSVLVVVPLVE